MIIKWFFIGAIIGVLVNFSSGGGFEGAVGCAVIFGGIGVVFRKWLFRTFWE